jgi:hypothetical protein
MRSNLKFLKFTVLVLLVGPLLWVGCITSEPPPPVTTKDFSLASAQLVQRLLEKGIFDKVANPPARVRIVTPVNNTIDHFDMDLFTQKIRVALSESGKVAIVMNPTIPSDYILSGKIISTYVRQADRRGRTYSFQLAVTDPMGTALWEGEEEFTK